MKKSKICLSVIIEAFLLSLFIASVSISSIHAQIVNLEEVVYLKNGSIVRGIIVEQVPNKTIKMQTGDGNLFVFKMEEILKITKEPSKVKAQQNNEEENVQHTNARVKEEENEINDTPQKNLPKEELSEDQKKVTSVALNMKDQLKYTSHYKFIAEAGYFFGTGEISVDEELGLYDPNSYNYTPIKLKNEDAGYSIRTVHACQVSETFCIGLGLGVDVYKQMTLMPLTADLRFDMSKGNTRPYINLSIGKAIPINADEGGLTFNIGFGIRTNSDWTFMLSYRLQEAMVGFEYDGQLYKVPGTMQFIAISSSYYF